jgi:hypothetical protein
MRAYIPATRAHTHVRTTTRTHLVGRPGGLGVGPQLAGGQAQQGRGARGQAGHAARGGGEEHAWRGVPVQGMGVWWLG